MCLTGVITNAQNWIQANGISNKTVRTIIPFNSDTLLAGVENEGIYISYDNGTNWEQFALFGESVYSLIKIDSFIIAGTYGNDVYKSTINNTQWVNISINNLVINNLVIRIDTLFACTYNLSGPGAIYFSLNKGSSWNQFASTPPYAYLDIDFDSQGRAFVATPNGAYYTDNQSSWTTTSGVGGTIRTATYLGNDSVIYGGDMGVFLSTNNGISGQVLTDINAGSVHLLNDTLYVALSSGGLYYSPSTDSTWISLNLDNQVYSLIKSNGKLMAGTPEGVYTLSGQSSQIGYFNNPSTINIYPNPVIDILYIENPKNEDFIAEIFNSNGQLLVTCSVNKSVNMSSFDAGTYYYRISNTENAYSGKIVKE